MEIVLVISVMIIVSDPFAILYFSIQLCATVDNSRIRYLSLFLNESMWMFIQFSMKENTISLAVVTDPFVY